jgi:CRP-like cAMP-binding protein
LQLIDHKNIHLLEPDLRSILDKNWNIPLSELQKFHAISKRNTISKGTYFIRAGEIPAKMALVLQGLFRYVYLSDTGKEYTKSFMPEGRFLSAYSSMITGQPAYFCVEALEDSTILEFSYRNWMDLRKSDPCWDRLLLDMIEKGFIAKEKRERELLLLDAESRYRIFLDEFPNLEGRVKQHIIASYLGITPERLSRIRKKMRR